MADALSGLAPSVIVAPAEVTLTEAVTVELPVREWRLEGFAPTVSVAPVKDEGEGAE